MALGAGMVELGVGIHDAAMTACATSVPALESVAESYEDEMTDGENLDSQELSLATAGKDA